MKKNILLILILILASCGKKEVKTDVNVDFSQFITGGFPVGAKVVLYGKSRSGRRFTRILNDTYFSSDIPVDIWNFYIIGWGSDTNSSNVFEGGSACAVAENVNLTGAEVAIDLVMTNEDCTTIDSSYILSGASGYEHMFKPITIKVVTPSETTPNSCSGGSGTVVLDGINYCLTTHSAKYFIKNSNDSNSISGGLNSSCIYSQGSINIPKLNPFAVSGFEIFSTSDCIISGASYEVLGFGSNKVKFITSDPSGNSGGTIYLII